MKMNTSWSFGDVREPTHDLENLEIKGKSKAFCQPSVCKYTLGKMQSRDDCIEMSAAK